MQLKGMSVVFYCVTKKTFMKTHVLIILAILTGYSLILHNDRQLRRR